eukprot:361100-Chlamydomonas_euryale.AAC.16
METRQRQHSKVKRRKAKMAPLQQLRREERLVDRVDANDNLGTGQRGGAVAAGAGASMGAACVCLAMETPCQSHSQRTGARQSKSCCKLASQGGGNHLGTVCAGICVAHLISSVTAACRSCRPTTDRRSSR